MKKSGFASTLCQILYFFEYKVSPAPTGKEQPRQIYLAEAVLFPGGRWAERPSAADGSCEATDSLRRRRSAARRRNTGRLRLAGETQAVCGSFRFIHNIKSRTPSGSNKTSININSAFRKLRLLSATNNTTRAATTPRKISTISTTTNTNTTGIF